MQNFLHDAKVIIASMNAIEFLLPDLLLWGRFNAFFACVFILLLILLALIHLVFPRYFHGKQELSSLSLFNRQLMYVHTFFIAFVVFLMGFLSLTSSVDLLNNAFGKRISLVLGIFWAVRLYIQFFGYSPKLWKGKLFERVPHILCSVFSLYLSVTFLLAGLT